MTVRETPQAEHEHRDGKRSEHGTENDDQDRYAFSRFTCLRGAHSSYRTTLQFTQRRATWSGHGLDAVMIRLSEADDPRAAPDRRILADLDQARGEAPETVPR